MSANPHHNPHRPDPREQFRERLSDIRNQRKGAVGLAVGLGGLAVILVTSTQDHLGSTSIAPFSLGVGCGVGAISMIVAIGALNGHKISAEAELATAEEVAALRSDVAEVRETLAAIVASGAESARDDGDEVAQQRQHHRDTR